ncbi:MAG: hypothetical protein CMI59_02390 [Parvibaculum sp.]|nr:hypothetical protein [Parvibaculum sp.]
MARLLRGKGVNTLIRESAARMTDFSAATVKPGFQPQAGKHNMASRAFEALRAQHGASDSARLSSATQDLDFGDLLDIANPLQHIPLVSEVYRSLTGDSISDSAQVVGDALYGGPLGLVSGVFSNAIRTAEGTSPGQAFVAAMDGETGAAQNPALAETHTKRQEVATAYRLGTPWREASANPAPAKPIRQAAAQATQDRTASADRTAGKGNPPIPQLSPAGFNAILSAFGDKTATAGLKEDAGLHKGAKTASEPAKARLAAADPAPVPPSGFAAAMANGLDKYRSMMDIRDRQAAPQ